MPSKTPSKKHKIYLAALKRDRLIVYLSRILVLVLFVVLWELATLTGFLDPFIFSSPSRIVNTIARLWANGDLFIHIGTTLLETILGFVIGTGLGVFFAIMLWWFPRAAKVADPYLVVLNSLPKIALGPVLIVWMGTGMASIVTIAVLVSVIVALSSVYNGFEEVDKEKILLLRSLGASKFQVLTMVILPASVPTMITALKLSVAMSWVGVIVGEFLVSRAGLGYLIVYGGQVFQLDIVMAGVVILCVLAGVMYYGIARLEKHIMAKRNATN